MNVVENFHQAILSTKIGFAVAAGTASSGVATINQWVPHSLGELSILIGIILSTILIIVHSVNGYMTFKKTRLEISALKEKERERLEAAQKRRKSGEKLRRSCDFTE